jgi:hypothetical protein
MPHHIDAFVPLSQVQTSNQGRKQAVAFPTIYKQPLPISHLPNVASAAKTLGWMFQQFPLT